jgi:hypothetical protein
VDADGDESIQSAMVSPSPAAGGSDPSVGADSPASFGGGGGGCFIGAAKYASRLDVTYVTLVLAMAFLFWILDCGLRIVKSCDWGRRK